MIRLSTLRILLVLCVCALGFSSLHAQSSDLSLTIAQDIAAPEKFTRYTVSVELTNDGPDAATDVIVNIPLMEAAGSVLSGSRPPVASTGTVAGTSSKTWRIPSIAAGATEQVSITYFSLVDVVPDAYAQVLRSGSDDPDSTPGNGAPGSVNEDDEASVLLGTGGSNDGGDGTIDLALSLDRNPATPARNTNYTVTVAVENTGSSTATGVEVAVPFTQGSGSVYKGGDEFSASQGSFAPYEDQVWTVGSIAPGASASLQVNYYLVAGTAPAQYAEVVAADQQDVDSTPGNGNGAVNEDDEALTTGSDDGGNEGMACDLRVSGTDVLCNDAGTPSDPSDDTFAATFTVTNDGTAASDSARLAVGNQTISFAYATATRVTLGTIASGAARVRISDGGDGECATLITVNPPATCSDDPGDQELDCAITLSVSSGECDDAGTPTDASDDFYAVTVSASNSAESASETYQLALNGDDLNSYSYGETVVFNVVISEGPANFTATDSELATCTASGSANPPATCSETEAEPECDLLLTVGDVRCDDAGTPNDPSDDTFSATVLVNSTTGESALVSYGDVSVEVAYGTAVDLQLGLITAAEGDITASDQDTGCGASNSVTAPEACSTPVDLAGCTFQVQSEASFTPSRYSLSSDGEYLVLGESGLNTSLLSVGDDGSDISLSTLPTDAAPMGALGTTTFTAELDDNAEAPRFILTTYNSTGGQMEQFITELDEFAGFVTAVQIDDYAFVAGEFVVVGTLRLSFDPSRAVPYVIRLDTEGEVTSGANLNMLATAGDYSFVEILDVTAGGDLFLGGTTFTRSFEIARISADDKVTWGANALGDLVSNQAISVRYASSANRLYFTYRMSPFAGSIRGYDATSGTEVFDLGIEADITNQEIPPGPPANGNVGSVLPTSNGDAVFGYVFNTGSVSRIARVSASGSVVFDEPTGVNGTRLATSVSSVVEDADGSLVFVVSQQDKFTVLKVQADGTAGTPCTSDQAVVGDDTTIEAIQGELKVSPSIVSSGIEAVASIDLHGVEVDRVTLVLTDVSGAAVRSQTVEMLPRTTAINLTLGGLKPGVYFVSIPGTSVEAQQIVVR